jgi:hypothetical protein
MSAAFLFVKQQGFNLCFFVLRILNVVKNVVKPEPKQGINGAYF